MGGEKGVEGGGGGYSSRYGKVVKKANTKYDHIDHTIATIIGKMFEFGEYFFIIFAYFDWLSAQWDWV